MSMEPGATLEFAYMYDQPNSVTRTHNKPPLPPLNPLYQKERENCKSIEYP